MSHATESFFNPSANSNESLRSAASSAALIGTISTQAASWARVLMGLAGPPMPL
jgi:hypothetical protein